MTTLPGRPAGFSDQAIQIESDRLLVIFDSAGTTNALLTQVTSTLNQAAATVASGTGTANDTQDHFQARLTQYVTAGGPLDLYFRGRLGANNSALAAVFTAAFGSS